MMHQFHPGGIGAAFQMQQRPGPMQQPFMPFGGGGPYAGTPYQYGQPGMGFGGSIMPNADGTFTGAPAYGGAGGPRPTTGPSPFQWGQFPAQSAGSAPQPANQRLMARMLMGLGNQGRR